MKYRHILLVVLAVATTVVVGACARRQSAPVTTPQPAPPVTESARSRWRRPRRAVRRRSSTTSRRRSRPGRGRTVGDRTLEELNRDSPLKPVFFPLDSSELDDDGRAVVAAQCRDAEAESHVGHHHRGPLRRARHGRIQPRAGRTAGRWPPRPTWSRSASPDRGSRPPATATSSRSIRAHRGRLVQEPPRALRDLVEVARLEAWP